MSDLTLLILRLVFLLVLWGFVFAVVYALRTDLFGPRVRRELRADVAGAAPALAPQVVALPPAFNRAPAAQTPASAPSSSPAATAQTARRLVITAGAKEGLEIPLGSKPLTIGRSSDSGLVIRDDYTSTHHARLMIMNDSWVIQDLDSTNGTFIDGGRVVVPTQVPLNTPIKIGTTSFELRR